MLLAALHQLQNERRARRSSEPLTLSADVLSRLADQYRAEARLEAARIARAGDEADEASEETEAAYA
jgi:hypothetical protein